MTSETGRGKDRSPGDGSGHGARTAVGGTAHAVDLSRDRKAWVLWVVLLAGPVIWFAHFMAVYLVVEAGCSGSGPGLALFNPPVPSVATLAATGVAAVASLAFAAWTLRRWRPKAGAEAHGPADDGETAADEQSLSREMAFGGFLLSLLSFVTILYVGLPALFLPAC